MKKRKGSLLIAITLLSAILLIILMTIFNMNRRNAELISIKTDREKAYQAASSGLYAAAGEIEQKIDEMLNSNQVVTWDYIYNQLSGTSTQNNNNKYSYSYGGGKITSTASCNGARVTLTANYAMDYMGVSASEIKYIEEKTKVASINSIYSYDTQYPMTAWINVFNPPQNSSLTIPTPNNGYLSNENFHPDHLISNFYMIYDNTLSSSIITGEAFFQSIMQNQATGNNNVIHKENNFNINNNNISYNGINSLDSQYYVKSMLASLNIQGNSNNKLYVSTDNINEEEKSRNLIKKLFNAVTEAGKNIALYDSMYNLLEADDNYDAINVSRSQVTDNNSSRLTQVTSQGGSLPSGIYKFQDGALKTISTTTGKKTYLFQGRNLITIPLNSTLVIDGDIILAPFNDSTHKYYDKYYKTIADNNTQSLLDDVLGSTNNDLSKPRTSKEIDNDTNYNQYRESYPVLLVTGNLVVNGSIKGIGTVFAMNNIMINALPEAKPSEKNYKLDEGAVIVHACNQLYIANEFSLIQSSNPTASWVLTQDRNALARVSLNQTHSNPITIEKPSRQREINKSEHEGEPTSPLAMCKDKTNQVIGTNNWTDSQQLSSAQNSSNLIQGIYNEIQGDFNNIQHAIDIVENPTNAESHFSAAGEYDGDSNADNDPNRAQIRSDGCDHFEDPQNVSWPNNGNDQGGNSQGGNSQGGNSQGGNSQGGNSQGGNSQGGNENSGNRNNNDNDQDKADKQNEQPIKPPPQIPDEPFQRPEEVNLPINSGNPDKILLNNENHSLNYTKQ